MAAAAMDGSMMDDAPLTLNAIFDRAERLFGGSKVASREPGGAIVHTDLSHTCERTRRAAAAFRELGVGRGDRVATLLWNQLAHLELYFAVPGIGAVLHPLNPRLGADELRYLVATAEDRIIVVDESLLEVFESFHEGHDFEQVIVVSHGAAIEDGALDYESLMSTEPRGPFGRIDETAAAAMCFTSGTTGRPKGVVYSHRALALHAIASCSTDGFAIGRRDVVMPIVPLFHANGWGFPHAALMAGAGQVLPGPELDALSILELLDAERVTLSAAVPTVWMPVLAALDAEPDRWDLAAVRELLVGGAPMPPALLEGFARHGIPALSSWGMTEMSPLGTVCRLPPELDDAPADERLAYRLRQGTPIPFVELRARDDEDELVPWDDETMGELEVRGPTVVAEYLGGAGGGSFTADGWFRTGDVVTIDRHGCIRICDRSKDLVKSGGEWISSVDLENHLMSHPDLLEAAVVAIPDERWGERPLAVVVLKAGSTADDGALREHLSSEFPRWQLPDRFEYLDQIPRTATGKFKKSALRERFAPAS